MSQHILPVRTYLNIFFILLGLLFLTVAAAYLPLGRLNLTVAMMIATTKALLILLYFMHVRYSSKLTWAFAGSAFIWLGILVGLTMTDYLTRPWFPVPGK